MMFIHIIYDTCIILHVLYMCISYYKHKYITYIYSIIYICISISINCGGFSGLRGTRGLRGTDADPQKSGSRLHESTLSPFQRIPIFPESGCGLDGSTLLYFRRISISPESGCGLSESTLSYFHSMHKNSEMGCGSNGSLSAFWEHAHVFGIRIQTLIRKNC